MSTKEWVNRVLEPTGIVLDGPNPWDPKVLNSALYNRGKAEGSLGLGEAYMDGWWECESLDDFFHRLLSTDIYSRIGLSLPVVLDVLQAKLFNLQAVKRVFEVGEKHYDLDNELFSSIPERNS